MELSQTIPLIAVLIGIVILANLAESQPALRPPLVILWLVLNGFFGVVVGFLQLKATALSLIVTLFFGMGASLLLIDGVRATLGRFLPKRAMVMNAEGTAELQGFDPQSPLQMTALILCWYLFANTTISFILAGGLSGLANQLQSRPGGVVSPGELLLQMSVFVLFAAAGTGLGTRRTLPEILARLGLRAPTISELAMGVGATFVMFGAALVIGLIWQVLTPRDVIERQTQVSGLIAASITTLTLAFLVAFTAAVGEEIAFRGALQPIFGIVPTTVIFALIHTQYTLTPASLVIIFVALVLGWLRKRYNTSVAIFAHFLYNFVPMALVIYGQHSLDMLRAGGFR